MNNLEKKKILITGAGQGLGEATLRLLAAEGATVIAADIKIEQVEKLAKELLGQGYDVTPLYLDVSDRKSIEDAFKFIKEKYGNIDVLINNAGIDVAKSISEITEGEFEKVIDVNLKGPFFMMKHSFSVMDAKQGGHVVNIVSTAAKRAWANASAYHASKWGLLGLSHALHVEGREKKIKVSAIVAGGMRTPFILERFPDTPLDVLQNPDNVANAIKFVLTQPAGTVIPEVMVIPEKETSWP